MSARNCIAASGFAAFAALISARRFIALLFTLNTNISNELHLDNGHKPLEMNEPGGWTQTIELISSKSKHRVLAKLLIDSQPTSGNLIHSTLVKKLELETQPCSEQWETGNGLIIANHKTHVAFQGISNSGCLYDDGFFVHEINSCDVIVGQEWINEHPEIVRRPRCLVLAHQKVSKEEEAKIAQSREKQRRDSEQIRLIRQQYYQQQRQSERFNPNQQQQARR